MSQLHTQHDIFNKKNTPYTSYKRAQNSLSSRVFEVCGHDVNVGDFHVVELDNNPEHYVIRHKAVKVINHVLIEPFVLYGVEFIATHVENDDHSITHNRFDTMKEALRYATTTINAFEEPVILRLKQTHPSPQLTKSEKQRRALGSSIFELIEQQLTSNRQLIKRAVTSNDEAMINKYNRLARTLRAEVWHVEENAEKVWLEQDYSLYLKNNHFPILNNAFEHYFKSLAA